MILQMIENLKDLLFRHPVLFQISPYFRKGFMVDILCGFGRGEFVLDGDFLECLGAEFRALSAVALGAEAQVGADDFLFSVG